MNENTEREVARTAQEAADRWFPGEGWTGDLFQDTHEPERFRLRVSKVVPGDSIVKRGWSMEEFSVRDALASETPPPIVAMGHYYPPFPAWAVKRDLSGLRLGNAS